MLRSTGALVLLLTLFFLFKILRFQTLTYTFQDMYSFLQMATGWLDGRPFMYENYWGEHQRIHNYYTVWLWGPICYVLGAYGLFLVQAVLLLIAYGLTNQRLVKAGVPNWTRYGLLVVILLGPISVWLNDHNAMGWHSELTYLPFGILFALALTGRGVVWPIVAGLGVTLVKEDGAVLAAMIHLAYAACMYLRQHPDRSLWQLVGERRFWFISLGWGAVFIAGMAWLAYQNNSSEPRLQVALSQIAQHVDTEAFWLQIGPEIGTTVLMLLPATAFIVLVNRHSSVGIGGRLLLLYGLGVAVLSVLNLVQSSLYYDTPLPIYHLIALTYPPRFVLPWAFTAAFLISIFFIIPLNLRPFSMESVWLIMSGLVLIQIPILYVVRPDLPDLAEWKALVRGQISPNKVSRYIDPADLAKIQCIAERLPARSSVIAFGYVGYTMPYFHKHYAVWPTGKQYRRADLTILPIDSKQGIDINFPMRQPYRKILLKGYVLYVATDYEHIVQPCLR